MIAAWMLYSSAFGILMVFAAMAVERFVHEQGGETRRVWLFALVATILLPALAMVTKDAPAAFELDNVVVVASPTAGAVMEGVKTLAPLDSWLAYGWVGASAILLLLMAVGLGATAWKARAWTDTKIDGVPVLLSEDVGPAVVGVLRNRIVVPQWILNFDPAERLMMLRHEQEHMCAQDPRLLLFGLCVGIAMPWNAAVWMLVRRMRLAIEVDCDRRVVHSDGLNLRRYAELLLAVGGRRSVPAYGVGFSVGRPFLEERIDRMTSPTVERRRVHAALVALGVVGVLAAAWSLPQPVRAVWISSSLEMCDDTATEVSRALLTGFDQST